MLTERELLEFISKHIEKELNRMKGLRRIFNPFVLQLSGKALSFNEKEWNEYIFSVRTVLEFAVKTYNRNYITKSEAKEILNEIRLPQLMIKLGFKDKENAIVIKFLNDLRRLNIVSLFISNNVIFKLPIIYPSWRENIRKGKRKLRIIGIFNENLLEVSEKKFKDALFLTFFQGNPITSIIKDVYTKYGTFNVNIRDFTILLEEVLRKIIEETLVRKGVYEVSLGKGKVLRTLQFIFRLKEVNVVIGDQIVIPEEIIEEIIKGLKIDLFDYKQYYEALKRAWKLYWGTFPSWYASLEDLSGIINRELSKILGKNIRLTLTDHLKYVGELAKWGKLEYWSGGLDPKRRHWIKLKKL